MLDKLVIRELAVADCEVISQAFAAQGWVKPVEQYQRYLQECLAGTRVVLVAEAAGQFAGYVCILWETDYPAFSAQPIPEIADFNVLKRNQRQGIGSRLLDEAEARIAKRSPAAGLGVGLTTDYGAAQIMYVKRGYVPDGRGVVQRGNYLVNGDAITVDDDLTLYFTKRVG